ncbi:MAG: hypothetical protein NW207_09510 [Cytophagales bacterium]|nr:hypothetical protein [Cytophagales bacterium]
MSALSIIIVLLLIGLIFIVAEVLFIPGTTFVGFLGFAMMSVGVWYSFRDFGSVVGLSVAGGSLLLIILTFYVGYKKGVWKLFALGTTNDTRLETNYLEVLEVGLIGKAVSALRPAGTGEFQGKRVEVQTYGELISTDTSIIIVEIKGNEIFVKANA